MKKVCHITTVHPNRYDVRIFERECTSLAGAGYDVTLIVNDTLPEEIKNGVRIISIERNRKSRLLRFFNVRCAYKKALEVDAELYHLHDPELLLIAKKLIKKGKKVIFDCHDFTAVQIMTKEYLPYFSRRIISRAYKNYEASVLKKLSGVICPCTYEGKDYFEGIDIPKAIVGNFPSLKLLDEATKDVGKDTDEKKVCYVGDICEARGVFHMVKASALAKKKLVLIGPASEDVINRLKAMPEYGFVEYLGKLPHEEALKVVKRCALGLTLLDNQGQYMKTDNLPTKTYEYMYLGLPVVMSDAPYWKKVLSKYPFGIAVDPRDYKKVAEAIIEILDNQVLYNDMVSEGRKAILESMNWESDSKQLVTFYESLFSAN